MRRLPARPVASSTSVTPTSNSPLRRPSAANTSLVATGTRGLTSTQGIFGRLSGSSVSPTPVMTQACEARHTGTSAPVIERDLDAGADRRAQDRSACASRRSAAAASAEPPPMPAATGSTLSRVKSPSLQIRHALAEQLRGLEHEIVGGLAAGLRQRPRRRELQFGAGRQASGDRRNRRTPPRFRDRDSRRRGGRPPAGSG